MTFNSYNYITEYRILELNLWIWENAPEIFLYIILTGFIYIVKNNIWILVYSFGLSSTCVFLLIKMKTQDEGNSQTIKWLCSFIFFNLTSSGIKVDKWQQVPTIFEDILSCHLIIFHSNTSKFDINVILVKVSVG